MTVLCWSVSNANTCRWLCSDTPVLIPFCSFPRKIHFCVDFSVPSCQPTGISLQPLSSTGAKQQHPGLGSLLLPFPCGGDYFASLIEESGRTRMQERECKWCDNLKLRGNTLKPGNGQPQGEQCTPPVRLHLVSMGTTDHIPLSNRDMTRYKKKIVSRH